MATADRCPGGAPHGDRFPESLGSQLSPAIARILVPVMTGSTIKTGRDWRWRIVSPTEQDFIPRPGRSELTVVGKIDGSAGQPGKER